jgi:hypothetical protein
MLVAFNVACAAAFVLLIVSILGIAHPRRAGPSPPVRVRECNETNMLTPWQRRGCPRVFAGWRCWPSPASSG